MTNDAVRKKSEARMSEYSELCDRNRRAPCEVFVLVLVVVFVLGRATIEDEDEKEDEEDLVKLQRGGIEGR